MKSKPFVIAEIIKKSLVEELTGDEMAMLEFWINSKEENKQLYHSFKKSHSIEEDLTIINRIDLNQAWNSLEKKGKELKNLNHGWDLKIWIPLIASCFALCFYIFYFQDKPPHHDTKIVAIQSSIHKNDVKPASSEAVLVLDNGETLDLTTIQNDSIQANIKLKDDQLEYVKGTSTAVALKYNTLIVPKGGYYKIELSDGSKVWVNAMSKLKFPELFSKEERRVDLEGEAYFEISKDADRPFIVQANGTDIKVLGTHFNVDAYEGLVRTTLKEGRVEVVNAHRSAILKPGEFCESSEMVMKTGLADLDRDLAWYNNEFYFKKDNIQYILNQLSNWYNVEVKFNRSVNRNKVLTGSIDRNVPLSQVLEMLEYVGDIKFKISGNQLIVNNK